MKHVRIQSDLTIQVTNGLSCNDLTDKKAAVADKLKIQPTWTRCLIKAGKGIYPAEIAEWPTVKALAKDGKLTIGEIVDDDTELTSKVRDLKDVAVKDDPAQKKVERATKAPKVKVVQDISLDAAAGE